MIKDLLRLAIIDVTLDQISRLILDVSEEFARFQNHLSKNHLRDYLKTIGNPQDAGIDLFTLPDLVWRSICHRNSQINCYPLGEVTERSWKKTVFWLLDQYFNCYDELSDDQIHDFKFDRIKHNKTSALTIQDIVGRFLTNLLFELCMISVRSKAGNNANLGYAFQFKEGHIIAFKDQMTLRQRIESECALLSASIIPYFVRSLVERTITKKVKVISTSIQEILPFIDWTSNIPNRQRKPIINVVVGTAQLSSLNNNYAIEDDYIRIILEGKSRNVAFDLLEVEKFLKHPIHSLTKDLLEISFVVYLADLYVPRNQNLSRSLNILIPVRHKDLWIREASRLQQTISFLARDSVTLHFAQKKEKREKITSVNLVNDDKECTCLFSGGLDSAVGAVWAIHKGYNPTLVSYSPGNLSGIQSRLANQIESCTKTTLPHLIISWQPSKKKKGTYRLGAPPSSMLYQHLRSFFYLGLAFSIAIESSHKKVFMFENGPIAVNPLLSESHINTRTSHPVFLESYINIIKNVFGDDYSIVNPFIYNTKRQLVSYVRNKGMASRLIPSTSSCFAYARVRAYAKMWFDNPNYIGTHDGDCFPCITRRISLHHANIASKYDEHLIDVFNIFDSPIFLKMPEHSLEILVRIADLLRFHEAIKVLSPYQRVLLFPDLYPYIENINPLSITNMYKRYADEVLTCFREKSSAELLETMKQVLLPEVKHGKK